jgi:hypothetical protein
MDTVAVTCDVGTHALHETCLLREICVVGGYA